MARKDEDYDVGYGKPPKENQFKPGQSGNPNGRPKGTRNLKTDLQEELNEKVQITHGGKTRTVSKQRAMLMSAMQRALKGDVRAIEFIAKLALQHLGDEVQATADAPLSAEEETILNGILEQRVLPGDNKEAPDEN